MSSLHQAILEKLQMLPHEKQEEVLNFIATLQPAIALRQSRPKLRGIWADVDEVTELDLRTARQEMWGNFPRAEAE
jgi:hypothetical protein